MAANISDNDQNIILKESLFIPVISFIMTPLIIFITVVSLSHNLPFSLTISFFFLLLVVIYYYFNFTTFVLSPAGLSINKRSGTRLILWSDIISMATVAFNDTTYYEIKTPSKTFRLPVPQNFQNFENFMENHASLESAGNVPLLFNVPKILSRPGLKRWRKIGRDYQYTSFSDRLMNPAYHLFDGAKLTNHKLLIVIITIVALAVLVTYLNSNYVK